MKNLPYLDEIVIQTLNFFEKEKNIPKIETSKFDFPLILGSGNGFETGKILFRKNPAIFASESDANDKININQVREVVIFSASGEKHAPILANLAKNFNKKTFLISSKQNSSASQIVDEKFIFPKITEPYTYNTSTYFGYIFGSETSKYQCEKVKNFIENEIFSKIKNVNFFDYEAFFIVLPNEFALLKNMVETKFIELFGRKIARDVATFEQIKHAMTVVPNEKELFIVFGNDENKIFGKNQINLPIFDRENYGPMMMIAYFVVGQIQKSLPNYFMQNIELYCENSEYNIKPIVD